MLKILKVILNFPFESKFIGPCNVLNNEEAVKKTQEKHF